MATIHDRLGNRTQALRTCQQCARCLREELDADPLPETAALHEEIQQR